MTNNKELPKEIFLTIEEDKHFPNDVMVWGMEVYNSTHYTRTDTISQWQPIDTAPLDGEVYLICIHEYGKIENPLFTVVARWREGFWRQELTEDHIDDTARTWEPVYWMPLPNAPKKGGE